MLDLIHGTALGLLRLLKLRHECSLIPISPFSFALFDCLVSGKLNFHFPLCLEELFFLLFLDFECQLLFSFFRYALCGCKLLVGYTSSSLSLLGIFLIFNLSPLTGLFDFLLSKCNSFFSSQIALILFLNFTFTLLLDDEELLVEIGIIRMLFDPTHGSLKRLPICLGHEQCFFRCMLAKAHCFELRYKVLLHVG